MKDSTLFKISLACSLAGIVLILFISERLELPLSDISSITRDSLDKDVKIQGSIASIKETPGLIIFKIKDITGEITVITFKEDNLTLEKNDLVEIQGKVTEYKNILEINANLIIKL